MGEEELGGGAAEDALVAHMSATRTTPSSVAKRAPSGTTVFQPPGVVEDRPVFHVDPGQAPQRPREDLLDGPALHPVHGQGERRGLVELGELSE